MRTRWVLVAIALLTAVIQFASASGEPDKTLAPLNAAQEIAAHLAWEGRYVGGNWVRLKGVVRPEDPPLRAFNLPGYVWYAAAMWRAFPRAHRYIQIPVVVLLTVAVAATAAALGGPMLGLLSGLIAALDPFMVVHGPVWDDAVFGTALVWTIFAIAAYRWRRARDIAIQHAWVEDLVVLPLAALAALTRTEAQALLLVLSGCAFVLPGVRALRRMAAFAIVGVMIALATWGIRNDHAIGELSSGSTHDGITLWESNGPIARRALALGQVDRLSQDSSVMLRYWSHTQLMTEAASDTYFRQEAIRYIESHPLDVAATALRKLLVSFSGVRPERRMRTPRNVVSITSNFLLLFLAGVSVVQLVRAPFSATRTTLIVMMSIVAAVTIGLLLIGPAGIRYWLTFRAELWVLSALTLTAALRHPTFADRRSPTL